MPITSPRKSKKRAPTPPEDFRGGPERQAIAAELERLEDQHGSLTPDIVVAAAREPDNPLHRCPEFLGWDAEKASEAYYLAAARRIIASVHIIVRTETTRVSIPAYIRDPEKTSNEQGYRSVSRLKSEEDSARAAIVEEFARAGAHLKRARDLATYLGSSEEIDDLIQRADNIVNAFI